MSTIKHLLTAGVCAFVLAGCDGPAPHVSGSGGFTGAMRSDGTMLLLPDGCTGAFLFRDRFAAQRVARNAAASHLEDSRYAILNAPAHMEGRDVMIDVRMSATGPAGALGTLIVEFAGGKESFPVTLTRTAHPGDDPRIESEDVFHRFTMAAHEGSLNLITRVLLSDAVPANADAMLEVDSVEVIYADPPACPALPAEQQGDHPATPRPPPEIPAPPPSQPSEQ